MVFSAIPLHDQQGQIVGFFLHGPAAKPGICHVAMQYIAFARNPVML
jgi:hypothetical protein